MKNQKLRYFGSKYKGNIFSFREIIRFFHPLTSYFLLICLCFVLAACQNKEEKFEKLKQKAKEYSSLKKWEEAKISLLSASDLKPDDAQTYFDLAEIYMQQQKFSEAVESLKTCLNYDQKFKDARLQLSSIYLLAREYELAEDQAKKVLELDQENQHALLILANIEAASSRKDFKKARQIFQDVLKKNPQSVGALSGLGALSLTESDFQKAEDFFVQALKIDSNNTAVRITLADLYSRQGRLNESQEMAEDLIRDNPENTSLRYGLGEFLLKRGFTEEAIAQYQEMIKINPLRNDARDRLYDIYLARNKKAEANKLTADLKKTQPGHPSTKYFEGRDAELLGQTKEALDLFQSAVAGMNNFAPAYRRLGLQEINSGEVEKGIQHLNQAIALDPADIGARLMLAQLAIGDKNFTAASEHVKQILDKFPRQLGANIMRADIALFEGNSKAAREVYQYLVDNFPTNPTGYLKLALLEEKEKNFNDAIEFYRKVLTFDQAVSIPGQRLAGLLIMKQGLDKTIADFINYLNKSKRSKAEYKLILGALTLSNISDKDRIKKAKDYFSQAVEENPALLGGYFGIAGIDARSGNLDSAIINYKKLLEKNPKHIPTYMLLALAYEQKGKFQDAIETYRKVLDYNPRFAPAANNLAWLLTEKVKGNLDEALKLAQIAKEILPNQSSVSDTIGWIHFKRGSKTIALSMLEEAIAQEKAEKDEDRINPEILFHLAQVQAAVGQNDQAKKSIAQAIEIAGEKHPLAGSFLKFKASLK